MALVHILAVGRDPMVLSSRCSVLRSADYIVQAAASIAEAIDRSSGTDFDLVLLCHSIPVEDRERLIGVLRSSGSRIRIYTVAPATTHLQADSSDGVLSSLPTELLAELEAALRVWLDRTAVARKAEHASQSRTDSVHHASSRNVSTPSPIGSARRPSS